MIPCQDHPPALRYGDPAADLQALAALINHNQIEFSFTQVPFEHLISSTHIGAADYASIVQDLSYDLLL